MKRSRIICSIIAVIYIILSVALTLILLKSNMVTESSVGIGTKVIYLVSFVFSTLMYIWVRNRLSKKMSNKDLSIKISRMYCYLYLAVITLISRCIMAYMLNTNEVSDVIPGIHIGLGSYINYGLGKLVNNQMYANVIINTVLTFLSCVIIKRIVLNITDNDMVATTTSIAYLLAPQSLAFVTEYIKYGYNVLLVLVGIYVFLKIIDEVKKFNKKSNKYLIYVVSLGVVQALDIALGGSYLFWVILCVLITSIAMYVDVTHITFGFKHKLEYKLKRIAEKIERINISKLIYVSVISLAVSGICTLICSTAFKGNYLKPFSIENVTSILIHSRSYYLVLIVISLIFEIIALVVRRKNDEKMYIIKIACILTAILIAYTPNVIYAACVFDALLILNTTMNVCNIGYNREERIKLLKEKN